MCKLEYKKEVNILLLLILIVSSTYDYSSFKIPNKLFLLNLSLVICLGCLAANNIVIYLFDNMISLTLLSIFSILIKCLFPVPSGDLKLFIIIILCLGVNDGLNVIFDTLVLSLLVLIIGVKVVPLSVSALLSYIPFYIKTLIK